MELPIIVTRLIQILKGKLTIIISEDPRKVPRLSYLRYLKKKRKKGEEVKFLTLGKQQRYKKESKICIHNQVPEHPSY